MKKPKWLLATRMPGSVIYPRLFLALLVLVSGFRAFGVNKYLGESRLARSPFDLSETPLIIAGMVEFVCGVLLALGLFTRLAALLPLFIAVMIIVDEWSRIGTLRTADAINGLILAVGAAGVALMLLFRGGGVWSLDASLMSRS